MTVKERIDRWWPLPLGVVCIFLAFLIPGPYVDDRRTDVLLFALLGAVLILTALYPQRGVRIVAMWLGVIVPLSRAVVLMTNAPLVNADARAAGVLVWVSFSYLILILTIKSELASAVARRSEQWDS